MMRGTPPVTVGLPVRNGGDYLDEALESIQSQTFTDFEVIVSDNGSTDTTQEICESRGREDERIVYLRSEQNRGGAWNFNNVFLHARSPLFKFAAHDDICDSTFLQRCHEELASAGEDVVICHPRAIMIDAEGSELGHFPDHLDVRADESHLRLESYIGQFLYANPLFGLIRADALRSTRLLGSYDSADMVLLAELALLGKIRGIDDFLFKRRMHSKSSREANPSGVEVTRWFDPSRDVRQTYRRNRMFFELVRGIAQMPLSQSERARCVGKLFGAWPRRYGKMMVREYATGVAQFTSRLSGTST